MLRNLIKELETATIRLNRTTILYAEEAGILSLTNGKRILEEALDSARLVDTKLEAIEAEVSSMKIRQTRTDLRILDLENKVRKIDYEMEDA